MISECHGNKGGTTDDAFQVLFFQLERGASVGAGFDLFKFQYLLHVEESVKTLKKRKKMKSIVDLLAIASSGFH